MIWCLFGFSIFGRLFSELLVSFCFRFFWFVGETTGLSLVRLCDIEASFTCEVLENSSVLHVICFLRGL